MEAKRFYEKVALVTGASTGIGAAIAARLAKEGASVMLFARRKELLEKRVEEILSYGGIASYYAGSVTNDDDVVSCVEYSLNLYGRIDVLINNAGVELVRPFAMTSGVEWNNTVNVNLGGVIRFTQHVQRPMVVSGNGGVIINIASVYALAGSKAVSIYSMTKGGLISLTKSLAIELASRRIRVNAIAAGIVETDMTKRTFANLQDYQIEEIRQMHPLGFGTPQDIASCVAYLASDEARWITGTVLVIDGGYTAH